jgi:hypothetical protein
MLTNTESYWVLSSDTVQISPKTIILNQCRGISSLLGICMLRASSLCMYAMLNKSEHQACSDHTSCLVHLNKQSVVVSKNRTIEQVDLRAFICSRAASNPWYGVGIRGTNFHGVLYMLATVIDDQRLIIVALASYFYCHPFHKQRGSASPVVGTFLTVVEFRYFSKHYSSLCCA